MTATFQLLQKDGVIPKELTLKECYRTYIDPNKIDYENPEIWKHLKENDVLSIFQWDQPSGKKGIATTQPHTLDELTVANGLIRLMNEEGQESQLDRFVRIKNKPQSFEDEMREAGLTKEQRQLMHEELDRYHGCCAMQESFMLLSQKIAGYSQAEADKLRKVVANSFWRTPLSWVKQRAISEKAKCLIYLKENIYESGRRIRKRDSSELLIWTYLRRNCRTIWKGKRLGIQSRKKI